MIEMLGAKAISAILGLIALAGSVVAAYFKGRKSKAIEVQAETAETVIDIIKKDKEIETANSKSGADARRGGLRKYTSDSK